MAHTIGEIITRWTETHQHPGLQMYTNVHRWNYNVFAEGDVLYSYGHHFPLAVKLPWGYLLNGDRYSATTSRHQAILRRIMQNGRADDWNTDGEPTHRHAIIPFAALSASSIKRDSIELIDVAPDRWINREVRVRDEEIKRRGWTWNKDRTQVGIWHTQYQYRSDANGRIRYEDERELVKDWHPAWQITCRDGMAYETVGQHQLGESLIKAKVRTRPRNDTAPGWRYRTAYFISAWDNQDTQTYFFSEMPGACDSLDQAYEDLKPQTVKMGELNDRFVVRQGDIFAVETDYTTRDLKEMGASAVKRMDHVLGTNHVVTEQVELPFGATLGRGTLWHKPAGRPADHRRQTIGKKWSVLVKNTVPVAKRKGRR